MTSEDRLAELVHGDRPDAPEPGLLAVLVPHLAAERVEDALEFFVRQWFLFAGRRVGEEAARALGARLAEKDARRALAALASAEPHYFDRTAPELAAGLARLAEEAPPEIAIEIFELRLALGYRTSADELAALVRAIPPDRRGPFVAPVVDRLRSEEQPLALARLAPILGRAAEYDALMAARVDPWQSGALALAELALRRPELVAEAAARLHEVDEAIGAHLALRLGIESPAPAGPASPPASVLEAIEGYLAAQPRDIRERLAGATLDDVHARWQRPVREPNFPAFHLEDPREARAHVQAWYPDAVVFTDAASATSSEPIAEMRWPVTSERYVNVGVAGPDGRLVSEHGALRCGRPYLLAIDVGALRSGRITGLPARLPDELLPRDAELTVVLFAPQDGFVVDDTTRTGVLRLHAADVEVLRQPMHRRTFLGRRWRGVPPKAEWPHALWFPVVAPAVPGTAWARVSFFCEGTLVQSMVVSAEVAESDEEFGFFTAHADFTLTRSLLPETVRALASDKLSVLVNQSGDDANFYLQGAPGGPLTATIDAHQIEGLIRNARAALRRAAWGSTEEWRPGSDSYRYVDGDRSRLCADLERLAIAGFSIYDVVIDAFAERPAQKELQQALVEPTQIQIASKSNPRFVIPAAMLYDRAEFRDQDAHAICPEFLEALDRPEPLDEALCFTGRCPTSGEREVICPSGFWGFRHSVGMPISVARDAPPTIAVAGAPILVAGASTDRLLTLRVEHLDRVHGLRVPVDWRYSEDADKLLETLEEVAPAVAYFFCHGGLTDDDRPYIRIGANDGKAITRAMLRDLIWPEGGPLVFINGCHTTAVSPEQAVNLVSGFLDARAAGVIGTEITVFQELAVPFAEGFLRRFLRERQPVGAAIRGARLDLLKQGNPLGLAYIPFTSAGVRLAA